MNNFRAPSKSNKHRRMSPTRFVAERIEFWFPGNMFHITKSTKIKSRKLKSFSETGGSVCWKGLFENLRLNSDSWRKKRNGIGWKWNHHLSLSSCSAAKWRNCLRRKSILIFWRKALQNGKGMRCVARFDELGLENNAKGTIISDLKSRPELSG